MQSAADIAACRNGQRMSADDLQHRWTHEVRIAVHRRRAAMTRAVLPNTTARAQLPKEDDAGTGTDTTVPDDYDGIASFTWQQTATIDVPNL